MPIARSTWSNPLAANPAPERRKGMTMLQAKERAKKPHRTKCCGNCRFVKDDAFCGFQCKKHKEEVLIDEVCSFHKYYKENQNEAKP
jgi:hypothetical protein